MDALFDVLNGIRFALCFSLVAVFGRYLLSNRDLLLNMNYRRLDRIQAAVAFFTYEVGEAGWRGFVWWNHGDARAAFVQPHWYLVFIMFGVIAAIGSVCCLRVLLPDWWLWPTWLTIAAFVLITVLFSLS